MALRHLVVVAFALAAGCSSKQSDSIDDLDEGPDAVLPVDSPGVAGRGRAAEWQRGVVDSPKADPAVEPSPAEPAPPPPPAAAPARLEHPVFQLVDNRHVAHRYSDGDLVLDGGDVGFSRYTRFGVPAVRWQLGQDVDGERAAVADRLATLEVPLTAAQAKSITFVTARVRGAGEQRLTLKVNGRKPGKHARVDLVEGWITISIPVEPGYFEAGENQLVLETSGERGKIAVQWMRFGRSIGARDPRSDAVFDGAAGSVALAGGASLQWYVPIPDGAQLVAEVASPCTVELSAHTSDGATTAGQLTAGDGRVDLAPLAGRIAALSLTARGCPLAIVRAPRITLPGALPVALPRAEPPRHVILWVMDALRADKIPIFTPGARAQTPHFDELAKSSAVFRQFYVQGNESQTSHSSTWTGLYPAVHNVRLAGVGGEWKLGAEFDVLASELSSAHYTTIGVTGNGYVNESGGYARGFHEFRNMMRETGVDNGVIYGEQIVDAALHKLARHKDRSTYLFLGTIDTHSPWIARRPWIDVYSPGPYNGPFRNYGTAKDLGFKRGSMGCSIIPPPADIERLRAIYDSAISYHDVQLGRLIKQLRAWGMWERTMLIITADHGEELFEDQRCGHGGSLRDTLTRVPLLIYDPPRFPGGTIVEEGVEGVDVMPTVLDAIGAEIPTGPQGATLSPLAQGVGRGWPRPSYASQYEYAHAMRIGRWKLRVGARGAPLVGDMVGDPGETKNLAASHPVERRMLTDNLGLFLALRTQWRKAEWGVVTSMTAAGAEALDQIGDVPSRPDEPDEPRRAQRRARAEAQSP